MRWKPKPPERVNVPIAPMIDVVFLLLIYFMASSSLARQEAEIGFELPGSVQLAEPLGLNSTQVIEIREDGSVWVNSWRYDDPATGQLEPLEQFLQRFRAASLRGGDPSAIILDPADAVRHQRIVEVLDACTRAGIQSLWFADGP